tara:strand:+ start:4738 stop:4863 length:126 start_codon:yes stop_codon:yes gene_type:complete
MSSKFFGNRINKNSPKGQNQKLNKKNSAKKSVSVRKAGRGN